VARKVIRCVQLGITTVNVIHKLYLGPPTSVLTACHSRRAKCSGFVCRLMAVIVLRLTSSCLIMSWGL